MTNLLRGVSSRNRRRGRHSGERVADRGQDGTVDDNTDAWFVGFDPDITVGVWIGFDEKKSLGGAEQGSYAALPMWMEFMKAYIEAAALRKPSRPASRRLETSCSSPWKKGPAT